MEKRNYEFKLAWEAKSNSKGFLKYTYRTKTRERVGPLKMETGKIIESREEMSTNLLNDYFLSVFIRENQEDSRC